MTTRFLITTPGYDDTTTYCSVWSQEVIEKATEKGFRVINLHGSKANRSDFQKHISANKPGLVMFNGHGSKDTVTGHMGEPLLSCANGIRNESLSSGTIIYARTCNSASKLGPVCESAGCSAYIGYKHVFIFAYETARVSTPIKDRHAEYFFKVSNTIPSSILKGNTVKEAMEKADAALKKEIDYLLAHCDPYTQHIVPLLLWNKAVRTVCGDEDAKLQQN